MHLRHWSVLATILVLSMTLTGCFGLSNNPAPAPKPAVLTTMEITPVAASNMVEGDTQVFTATGKDQYGKEMIVEPQWSVTGEIGMLSTNQGVSTTFTATKAGIGSVVAQAGDTKTSADIGIGYLPTATALQVSAEPASYTPRYGEPMAIKLTLTATDQFEQQMAPRFVSKALWSVSTGSGNFDQTQGDVVSYTPSTWDSIVSVALDSTTASVPIKLQLTKEYLRGMFDEYARLVQSRDANQLASLYCAPFTLVNVNSGKDRQYNRADNISRLNSSVLSSAIATYQVSNFTAVVNSATYTAVVDLMYRVTYTGGGSQTVKAAYDVQLMNDTVVIVREYTGGKR